MFNWKILECHGSFNCWRFISHMFLSSPSKAGTEIQWFSSETSHILIYSHVFSWHHHSVVGRCWKESHRVAQRPSPRPVSVPSPGVGLGAWVIPAGPTLGAVDAPAFLQELLIVIKPLFRLDQLTVLWKERRHAHWSFSWQKDPGSQLQHHLFPCGVSRACTSHPFC